MAFLGELTQKRMTYDTDAVMSYGRSSSSYAGYDKSAPGGRAQSGFAGLINQGATCYLNSLLQSLYCVDDFRHGVFAWRGVDTDDAGISRALQALFAELALADRYAVSTLPLTKAFGWETAEAWVQHDVSEAQTVLLDALESQGLKDVSDIVTGRQEHYITCTRCKTSSTRQQVFLSVLIPVRGYRTMDTSLRSFFETETMEGDNAYECGTCKGRGEGKQTAVKGLRLPCDGLPPVLFVQLARFEFDMVTLGRRKVGDPFSATMILDMGQYAHAGEAGGGAEGGGNAGPTPTTTEGDASERASAAASAGASSPDSAAGSHGAGAVPSASSPSPPLPGLEYELCALLMHSGGASAGHYFAYIRRPARDVPGLWEKRAKIKGVLDFLQNFHAACGGDSALVEGSDGTGSSLADDIASACPYTREEVVTSLQEQALLAVGGGLEWAWLNFNDSSVDLIPSDCLPKALGQQEPRPVVLPAALLRALSAHEGEAGDAATIVAARGSNAAAHVGGDDGASVDVATSTPSSSSSSSSSFAHDPTNVVPKKAGADATDTDDWDNAFWTSSSAAGKGAAYTSSGGKQHSYSSVPYLSKSWMQDGNTGAYMLAYQKRELVQAMLVKAEEAAEAAAGGVEGVEAGVPTPPASLRRHGASALPSPLVDAITADNERLVTVRVQADIARSKVLVDVAYARDVVQCLLGVPEGAGQKALSRAGLAPARPGLCLDWTGTRPDVDSLEWQALHLSEANTCDDVLMGGLRAVVEAELREEAGREAASAELLGDPPSVSHLPSAEALIAKLLPLVRLRRYNRTLGLPLRVLAAWDEERGDGTLSSLGKTAIKDSDLPMRYGVVSAVALDFRRTANTPWPYVPAEGMPFFLCPILTRPSRLPDMAALCETSTAILVPANASGRFTVGTLREVAAEAINAALEAKPEDTRASSTRPPFPLSASNVRLLLSDKGAVKTMWKDDVPLDVYVGGGHGLTAGEVIIAEYCTGNVDDNAQDSEGSALYNLVDAATNTVSVVVMVPVPDPFEEEGRDVEALATACDVVGKLHASVARSEKERMLVSVPLSATPVLVTALSFQDTSRALRFEVSVDKRKHALFLRQSITDILLCACVEVGSVDASAGAGVLPLGFPVRISRRSKGDGEVYLCQADEGDVGFTIAKFLDINSYYATTSNLVVYVTPGTAPDRGQVEVQLLLAELAQGGAARKVLVPAIGPALTGETRGVGRVVYSSYEAESDAASGCLPLLSAFPTYVYRPLGKTILTKAQPYLVTLEEIAVQFGPVINARTGISLTDGFQLVLRDDGHKASEPHAKGASVGPGAFEAKHELGKPFVHGKTTGVNLTTRVTISPPNGTKLVVQALSVPLVVNKDDVVMDVVRLDPGVLSAALLALPPAAEGDGSSTSAPPPSDEPPARIPRPSYLHSESLIVPGPCKLGDIARAATVALGLAPGLLTPQASATLPMPAKRGGSTLTTTRLSVALSSSSTASAEEASALDAPPADGASFCHPCVLVARVSLADVSRLSWSDLLSKKWVLLSTSRPGRASDATEQPLRAPLPLEALAMDQAECDAMNYASPLSAFPRADAQRSLSNYYDFVLVFITPAEYEALCLLSAATEGVTSPGGDVARAGGTNAVSRSSTAQYQYGFNPMISRGGMSGNSSRLTVIHDDDPRAETLTAHAMVPHGGARAGGSGGGGSVLDDDEEDLSARVRVSKASALSAITSRRTGGYGYEEKSFSIRSKPKLAPISSEPGGGVSESPVSTGQPDSTATDSAGSTPAARSV